MIEKHFSKKILIENKKAPVHPWGIGAAIAIGALSA